MATLPPLQSLAKEHLLTPDGELDTDRLLNGVNQFMGSVHGALNKGLTLNDNAAAAVRRLSLMVPEYPWQSVTLENSWVNYSASFNEAAVLMLPGGVARSRGLIKDGTAAGGTTLFTLPAGWRPARTYTYLNDSSTRPGSAAVKANGTVTIEAGANGWFSLDDMEWDVASTSCAAPLPFAWAETPIVRHGLPRCTGVVPVACSVVGEDERTSTAGHYTLDWTDKGDGQLVIRSAYGLQPGKKYNLTLLCLSE